MTPVVLDTLPALVLPALVLLALALVMPFTGRRAAQRREAWARFHAAARRRALSGHDRELLAAWAREAQPEAPFLVLARRREFDRFARSEAQRWPGAEHLARVRALRERLGFAPGAGPAQSSHDLREGERVELRYDDGVRLDLRVRAVDEAALVVEPLGRARPTLLRAAPAWAAFGRDGDGTYRFRTHVHPAPGAGARATLAHGDFLLREERRREPRARLEGATFWVAIERLPDGFAPDDPEGVEVEALDVSSGGLALLADRDVRRGSELGLDLPLGQGVVVRDLRARVVGRGYREGGGRRAHFLHCKFVDLDPVQRRLVDEYVTEHAAA